jgi:hypothetical protein
LNLATVPDAYPLPNMMDFAARVAGCTNLSKIELQKGYYQILMHPADIEKTAVTMPFGLFEFTGLPIGLWNAGNTFQPGFHLRLLGRHHHRQPQHLEHLRQLFEQLQQFGLVIIGEKFILRTELCGFPGPSGVCSGYPSAKGQSILDFPIHN